MAKIHGVAGEWARVKGMVTGLWPLFLGVFAAGFSVAALVFGEIPFGVGLLAVSLIYCGWSLMKGLRHAERFFKGARGEERVSGILMNLPNSYHVLRSRLRTGTSSSTGSSPTATHSRRRAGRRTSSRRRSRARDGTVR